MSLIDIIRCIQTARFRRKKRANFNGHLNFAVLRKFYDFELSASVRIRLIFTLFISPIERACVSFRDDSRPGGIPLLLILPP